MSKKRTPYHYYPDNEPDSDMTTACGRDGHKTVVLYHSFLGLCINQNGVKFVIRDLKKTRRFLKKRLDFIMNYAIIIDSRGNGVKKHCLIKNGHCPLFLASVETGVDDAKAR